MSALDVRLNEYLNTLRLDILHGIKNDPGIDRIKVNRTQALEMNEWADISFVFDDDVKPTRRPILNTIYGRFPIIVED